MTDKLTGKNVEKACKDFSQCLKLTPGDLVRNEKYCDLQPFLQQILSNPTLLFQIPLNKKTKEEKID